MALVELYKLRNSPTDNYCLWDGENKFAVGCDQFGQLLEDDYTAGYISGIFRIISHVWDKVL